MTTNNQLAIIILIYVISIVVIGMYAFDQGKYDGMVKMCGNKELYNVMEKPTCLDELEYNTLKAIMIPVSQTPNFELMRFKDGNN